MGPVLNLKMATAAREIAARERELQWFAPISTSAILQTVMLENERDMRGERWCRESGIGMLRSKLGPVIDNPAAFIALPEHKRAVLRASNGARVLLNELCARCPMPCSMKPR
jgi:hypothetical protein